jgi:hypothetical protein
LVYCRDSQKSKSADSLAISTVSFKKADGEIGGSFGIDPTGKLRINSNTDECIRIDARLPLQSEIDAPVGPQVIFGSNGSPRGRIHLDRATSQMWLTAESFLDSNGATLPCAVGWEGADCGTDIAECDSAACGDHASCSELTVNSYTCICDTGFEGTTMTNAAADCVMTAYPTGFPTAAPTAAPSAAATAAPTGAPTSSPTDPFVTPLDVVHKRCTGGDHVDCSCEGTTTPNAIGGGCHTNVDNDSSDNDFYSVSTVFPNGKGWKCGGGGGNKVVDVFCSNIETTLHHTDGSTIDVYASCPDGSNIISGGCDAFAGTPGTVQGSIPFGSAADQWECKSENTGNPGSATNYWTKRATAICSTSHKVDVMAKKTGANWVFTDPCADGSRIIGGGCIALAAPFSFEKNGPETSGGEYPTGWACGTNSASADAYAVCLESTPGAHFSEFVDHLHPCDNNPCGGSSTCTEHVGTTEEDRSKMLDFTCNCAAGMQGGGLNAICTPVACPTGTAGDSVVAGCTPTANYQGTIDKTTTTPYYTSSITCAADSHFSTTAVACVSCAAGTTNDAGDVLGTASTCAATSCLVNQYVENNECTNCADGTFKSVGDTTAANTAPSTCAANTCLVNQYVENNECTDCAVGTFKSVGDTTAANTAPSTCTATSCLVNQYVENNECTNCADGTIKPVGDTTAANTAANTCVPPLYEEVSAASGGACPEGKNIETNAECIAASAELEPSRVNQGPFSNGEWAAGCFKVDTHSTDVFFWGPSSGQTAAPAPFGYRKTTANCGGDMVQSYAQCVTAAASQGYSSVHDLGTTNFQWTPGCIYHNGGAYWSTLGNNPPVVRTDAWSTADGKICNGERKDVNQFLCHV